MTIAKITQKESKGSDDMCQITHDEDVKDDGKNSLL